MMELFIEITKQLNSSVFTLIAVLYVVMWLLYKAGERSAEVKQIKAQGERLERKMIAIQHALAKIQAVLDLLYQDYVTRVQNPRKV